MLLSSLFHHPLESGLGFVFLMFSLMLVCNAVVRLITALFSCSVLFIVIGFWSTLSFVINFCLNLSHLMALKLNEGDLSMCFCVASIFVTMGKWSVDVGCKVGSTSHIVMWSSSVSVQKRLLGLEYFFVTMCCNVGIPFGSAMAISYVAISSIRHCADLVAC